MPFCCKCGQEVDKKATVCPNCGNLQQSLKHTTAPPLPTATYQPTAQPIAQPTYTTAEVSNGLPQQAPIYILPTEQFEPASGRIKGGMLAWSIINLVSAIFNPLAFLIILPLSIIALVMVSTAPAAANKSAEKGKQTTALVLNIISSALTVFWILLIISSFLAPDGDNHYQDFYI